MVQYLGFHHVMEGGQQAYIVQDSGFLDILKPYDTVMANCGFKIKSDLTFHRCCLAILSSDQ